MEKVALAIAIDNLTSQKKEENYKTKSYTPETNSINKTAVRNKKPANLVEIKSKNDNTRVSKSPKKDSFLLAINNLNKQEKTINYPNKDNISRIDNLDIKSEKAPKLKTLVAAKTENKNIKITENPKTKKTPLALPTNNPIKEGPTVVITTEPIKEKPNYISINVTDVYERVAQKGYKSVYMFKEMANQYFFKNQMEKAVKWYEELFAMNSELDPIYYYRFGEALKKTGNIQKGNAMIEKFNKLVE
ncbi:tetratricopeptide repeat protein [Flavobacterium magnesitis]|uniref:tetratricopeptide repeat protein n=1 Tax=Flavobacterium magnesitis TaxID=3138077 RepID=UPI00358F78FD